MIINEFVKIKKVEDLTSEYIDNELAKLSFDVLRWVITEIDNEYYYLTLSIVKD